MKTLFAILFLVGSINVFANDQDLGEKRYDLNGGEICASDLDHVNLKVDEDKVENTDKSDETSVINEG